jgi:hypothetical protein
MGGAATNIVALEQRDRHAALARAPGDRETYDPAADDRHVDPLRRCHALMLAPGGRSARLHREDFERW